MAIAPILTATVAAASVTALVAAPAHAAVTQVNDTDSSISYSGGWTYSTGQSGYYNGDAHYSGIAGATATLTFTGSTVAWIGADNTDHGKADAVICDDAGANCGPTTTVDTYAAASVPQVVLFSASNLGSGTHTLRITVRSDSSGTGHYTDIDAFQIGTPSAALTGTYYVDNAAGSACTDAGAGTSPSAPWCDFADLNGQNFGPGAHILLKRDDTFTGELGKLYGSGTAAAPIVLGAYGTGARPHITRTSQAADRAVWIQDASYWTVRDLELSNAGAGLVFWYTTNGHAGLTVTDVYTHDVQGVFAGSPAQADLPGMYHSAGILITGDVAATASATAVSGVTLSDLEGYNNDDDVDISGFDANSGGQQGFLSTTLGQHSVSQISLSESYFHHDLSGENFDNLQNMTITAMRLDDTGHGANLPSGTTALFFWSSSTVTVADSILDGEADTGSPDQTETDLEAFDDHIAYRGDYFGDSAGSPIEILEINGYTDNYQSSHEIADNLFTSYGSGRAVYDGTGGSPMNFSGTAHDNLYAATGSAFSNGLTGWPYSTGHSGYFNSDAHYIGEPGATATYTFTGTTVSWIGGENSDHGKAGAAVCDASGDDCGTATTVDTYAVSSTPQQTLYTASNLTDATHTLKITVRSDSSGTGHYTDVDAFVSGTTSGTTEVNDTDPSIAYSNAWTLTDNTAAAASTAYNAANDFSATQGANQWRAQYYTAGGGWLDISPYDAANQRWGSNGYVSRFDLSPDTCSACPIARAWVAPGSGTIAIRGRVLKETLGGDGVLARITRNGTQIWPASGGAQTVAGTDAAGYDTNVTLSVAAGDTIRFEVTDGGDGDATNDVTAWTPSIAYQ
ncbi:hypothetical protein [Catenulispora pinisilvae]|uniref:hypothetical protein n=1 Tax=Catenulispora pinisilvae TaxID=2705253 RepID=UPI001890E263|nr:hypothetical protein [Catenulispora pinisilvae]